MEYTFVDYNRDCPYRLFNRYGHDEGTKRRSFLWKTNPATLLVSHSKELIRSGLQVRLDVNAPDIIIPQCSLRYMLSRHQRVNEMDKGILRWYRDDRGRLDAIFTPQALDFIHDLFWTVELRSRPTEIPTDVFCVALALTELIDVPNEIIQDQTDMYFLLRLRIRMLEVYRLAARKPALVA